MRVIHRHPINISDWFTLPYNDKIIHFAFHKGVMNVWTEHTEPNVSTLEKHKYYKVFGTGDKIKPGLQHLKTEIVDGYVWHLYEEL